VDLVVVERAQRQGVLQRGRSAGGVPADVVDLAPGGPQGAAGPLAVPVADQDRPAQPLGEGALALAHVQRDPVRVQHQAGDLAVARQPCQLRRRHDRAVVELGQRPRLTRRPVGLLPAHPRVGTALAAPKPHPGLGRDEQGQVGTDLGAEPVVSDLQHPLTQPGQRIRPALLRRPGVPRPGSRRQCLERGAQGSAGDGVEEGVDLAAAVPVKDTGIPAGADGVERPLGGLDVQRRRPRGGTLGERRCVHARGAGEQIRRPAVDQRLLHRLAGPGLQTSEHLRVPQRHLPGLHRVRGHGKRGQPVGQLHLRPRRPLPLPRRAPPPRLERPIPRPGPPPPSPGRRQHPTPEEPDQLHRPVQLAQDPGPLLLRPPREPGLRARAERVHGLDHGTRQHQRTRPTRRHRPPRNPHIEHAYDTNPRVRQRRNPTRRPGCG
jgi:hypothetical protein